MKRIALNMLFAGGGVAGGRVYAEGLLRGLAEIAPPDFAFTCFTRRTTQLPVALTSQFEQYRSPVAENSTLHRTWWEYVRLPRIVSEQRFDLFHGLGCLSPSARGCPLILSLHDLIYLHYPESNPLGYRLFIQTMGPRSARKAERIIVPSRHTAQEVQEHYGIKEDRLRIVPIGWGIDFPNDDRNVEELAKFRSEFAIRGPYLLSVARGYPHKNLGGLLRAFAILKRQGWGDVPLVLVGQRHLIGKELTALCQELGLEKDFIFTGFVDNDRLFALYRGAEVFVFPSLAEGFGMPPLEAMACGVPVVASNSTSVPEVVGDAGLLVNAREPEELASVIARFLSDAALRANNFDKRVSSE